MGAAHWAEEQALQVAKEIHRLRKPRSAQWLAEQTEQLGHEVTRSVIADLENGRRRYVTTAELTVLARALKVPTITLLFSPPYNDEIEMLPGVVTTKLFAVERFCGNPPRGFVPTYGDNTWLLQRAREISSLEDQQRSILEVLDNLTQIAGEMAERYARPCTRSCIG